MNRRLVFFLEINKLKEIEEKKITSEDFWPSINGKIAIIKIRLL